MKLIKRTAVLLCIIGLYGCATLKQIGLSNCYDEGQNYIANYESCLAPAENGVAHAQYVLAYLYIGSGTAVDYKQAFKWNTKAAEQGHLNAQASLGWQYLKGHGVSQDYIQAFKLLRNAADRDNLSAQLHLGYMYEWGHGVNQDDVLAHMWYNIAASLGNENAINKRMKIAKRMPYSELVKATSMALEWMDKPPIK